jgi:hypothetical protein
MCGMETILRCHKCKQEKPSSEFGVDRSQKRGFNYQCKKCVYEYRQRPEVKKKVAAWERNHRGAQRRARRNRRIEAIQKLGGKCECCGETQIEFLAFDHIHGLRGREFKRNGNDAGDALALRIRKEVSPEKEFRVLCHNCNSALGFYGYCPHKTKKDFLHR